MSEFEERFATEAACRQYLFDLRWPGGFRCPQCGHNVAWAASRGRYVCRKCRHQASLTAGTIFQDTRKPLRQWFRAMWHVTNQKHGVSALGLQRALGLGSYSTAWTWLHKLRRAMVRPHRDRLNGLVEVDETFVGGVHPGKPGRGAAGKALVLIATERAPDGHIGRIRLRPVSDAAMATLHEAVEACVQPGAMVQTDSWRGYNALDRIGYQHDVVRSTGERGENLLPGPHRVAALLKRWLLGIHQGAVRESHLEYYLDEFTFRFNRRTSRSRGMLFYRLAQQAVTVDPLPKNRIGVEKPAR